MNCPYPDCAKKNLHGALDRCPQCHRQLKLCASCKELNRSLSRFCRSCGVALTDSPAQWTGYQGGPERRGLNPHMLSASLSQAKVEEVLEFQIEDRCSGLLFYDGYLVAVSASGVVVAVDLFREYKRVRWTAVNAVTAHPCIANSTLFLAGEDRIVANSLAGLARTPPQVQARWSVPVNGTPVHSLLTLDNWMYLTVASGRGDQKVVAIEGIHGNRPSPSKVLYEGGKISSLVGSVTAKQRRLFFLSGEDQIRIHWLTHQDSGISRLRERRVDRGPRDLIEHVPIACIGKKVFAVFGDDDQLCRIDGEDVTFDERLRADTRSFALSGLRDGVIVQSAGLYFLSRGVEEIVHHPIKGPPVVLRERAVAIGLTDGRLRLHDLYNPPSIREWRISSQAAVSVIASWGHYLAAGTEDGNVKLLSFVDEEGTHG